MTTRNYPQEIEEQSILLADLILIGIEARRRLEAINDDIARDVLSAIDPQNGKPVYSNDKARELAIRDKCRSSSDWLKASEEAEAAELTRAAAAARLERLRGEFSESKIQRRERIAAIDAAIN